MSPFIRKTFASIFFIIIIFFRSFSRLSSFYWIFFSSIIFFMSSLESLADFSMKIREGHAGFSPKISTVRKKIILQEGETFFICRTKSIFLISIYKEKKDIYLTDVKQKRAHVSQLCRNGRIPYPKAVKRIRKGNAAKDVLFDRGKEFSLLTGK